MVSYRVVAKKDAYYFLYYILCTYTSSCRIPAGFRQAKAGPEFPTNLSRILRNECQRRPTRPWQNFPTFRKRVLYSMRVTYVLSGLNFPLQRRLYVNRITWVKNKIHRNLVLPLIVLLYKYSIFDIYFGRKNRLVVVYKIEEKA